VVSHTPSVVEPVKQHRTRRAQLPERSTRTQNLAQNDHGRPPLVTGSCHGSCSSPALLYPPRVRRPWLDGWGCRPGAKQLTPSDAGHGGRAPPATAARVGYKSPSDSSSEPMSDPCRAQRWRVWSSHVRRVHGRLAHDEDGGRLSHSCRVHGRLVLPEIIRSAG